jgi:hypothetical protein
MVLMLALLQAASGHVLEREAETAADAAALAAVGRWGDNIEVRPGWIVGDEGGAEAAAQQLASQNDATLESLDGDRLGLVWRATVTVETNDEVIDGPVDEVTGETVRSTSTAEVQLTITPLPSQARTDIEDLEDSIGIELRGDSALNWYAGGTCATGVDTDRLSDDMKIAILRIEDELGDGIRLNSGYATSACLAAGGVEVPGLSPARTGDQVELSAYDDREDAADEFRSLGFCEPTPYTFVSPDSPACTGGLSDLVSFDTRLVPNP